MIKLILIFIFSGTIFSFEVEEQLSIIELKEEANIFISNDAYLDAISNYEKEHVTPFIWDNPKNFELSNYKLKNDDLYEKYRLTLDYKEDFFVIWSIFNKLYKKKKFFELKNILDYLKKNPNILKNNHFIKVNWYMNYHKSLKTINKKYYKKN